MYGVVFAFVVLLSGCANFTINGTMCDQVATEPGAVIPKECRNYDEAKAQKAFDKVVDEKKVSDKDITFEKDK